MTTLDKIRAEIKDCLWKLSEGNTYLDITREEVENAILDIIDKYAEQSGWEEMTVSCKHCGKDMTFKIATIGEPCEGCKYKSMAEQEPCDDAISREAVVDDFIEWREKLEYTVGEDYSGVHLLNVAIQKIWDMPSVTPKPTECGDVVSRQAVLEIAKQHTLTNDYLAIQNLPSVRPQEQTGQFAEWVAREIFDDMWEYNKDAFAELACRKLAKLGLVREKGNEWELVEPQESEEV